MEPLTETKNSTGVSESSQTLKELRVLVLATTFPRWENDTEPRFIFDLTKPLAEKISLWVLAPHAPGAKIREDMEGVQVIRFPYFFPRRLQTLCYEGGIDDDVRALFERVVDAVNEGFGQSLVVGQLQDMVDLQVAGDFQRFVRTAVVDH